LPVLLDDLRTSCGDELLAKSRFLFSLTEERSLPRPLAPASPAHLRSVLHALSALLESRHAATLRDA
jgi:hypothetical protein